MTAWSQGLREAGLPEAAITLVPTRDRAAVGLMLAGLNGGIDVIVPRGGKSLVARVQAEARVPVFAHLEGVNHVYVDRAADLDMAKSIVLNAKMRRTGVCGAAETLLVDRAGAADASGAAGRDAARCRLRGARRRRRAGVDARVKPATERTGTPNIWTPIIAARVVDGVDEAHRAYRAARLAPHRSDRHRGRRDRRSASSARSIPRSCCTTPRRSSPMAASSASARRSASRPANSTRAGRSAPSN